MTPAKGLPRLLAYAAIYVLWGGSFLGIRVVVAQVPPFTAAAFRFVLAGLALFLFARIAYREPISRREWRNSALLGFTMFTCNYACLFWAEKRLSSSLAAVLEATIPIWVFLGEWLVLRTLRVALPAVVGIALGLAGVILLARSPGHGSAAGHAAALILVAGTVLWSAGTLWSRSLALPGRQTTRAGLQMMTGGLFLFALAAAAGEFSALPAAVHLWNWKTAAAMAYLIVAASIIAFTCYTWLIAHEPPSRVASYAYVNPLFALLIGAALAHERMSPLQWAGAACVIAGVFATLSSKQRTAPAR
jgi:drug/metabolite transporter (DMT)-like permease